jgi:glycerol-3-phosphate acyltransferase PlsX
MLIAVDTAGGDFAPLEIVKGAVKAAEEYGLDIALIGNRSMLHVLASRYLKKLNISIIDAPDVMVPGEAPIKAVRAHPNSAIVIGINMVKEGTAAAFVSAGSTGAVVAAALLNLGKIEGVARPALCGVFNVGAAEPVLLIDAGANVDCRPDHVVQFARLGAIYCERVIGTVSPRIGLLNNGEEPTKGNRLVRETYRRLKETSLNFVGNMEGHDIPKRSADVFVTDGFTGNIVLKTIEGMGDTMVTAVRQFGRVLSSAYNLQGRAFIRDVGLARDTDYREYGGACLLGVNGNVIVAHGRSKAKAIKNAIGLAKQTAEQGITEKIKEEMHERSGG